jgi:hypothetical protein
LPLFRASLRSDVEQNLVRVLRTKPHRRENPAVRLFEVRSAIFVALLTGLHVLLVTTALSMRIFPFVGVARRVLVALLASLHVLLVGAALAVRSFRLSGLARRGFVALLPSLHMLFMRAAARSLIRHIRSLSVFIALRNP